MSLYYCLKPTYDGYESMQLLEQNGGYGNNGAQLPAQINNIHNAGESCATVSLSVFVCVMWLVHYYSTVQYC